MSENVARAVIFNADGKLLMIERLKHGKRYFVLPGGHADNHEDVEATVIREVHEETGLAVTVARLLYIYTDLFGSKQHIFLCNYEGGEPKLREDSVEYAAMAKGEQKWLPGWFAAEELRERQIYPEGLLDWLDEDVAREFANNPREM